MIAQIRRQIIRVVQKSCDLKKVTADADRVVKIVDPK